MNAIRHSRIGVTTQEDGSVDIVIPASMVEDFKLMVKKGTNLNPDMHVEIRDFADRLFKREHLMNGNMLGGIDHSIVSTHWDIPAEDKMMLAEDKKD